MIITVAFYDQDTGQITEIARGPPASIVADKRPYVDLPEFRPDWDMTHHVVDHQLVARPASDLQADLVARAWVAVRERRNSLLREKIDGISPVRWSVLSDEQKADLQAYREALLAWPNVEQDPMNHTEPPAPAWI
jgi:hypothetical protein